MLLEVLGALALGSLALWLIFAPASRSELDDGLAEPEPPEETRRGIALLALKEIDFDRETGKLSEADHSLLKARYSAEALDALAADESRQSVAGGGGEPEELIGARARLLRFARSAGSPPPASCPRCGPRPEADPVFCSECGTALVPAGFCSRCGAALPPDSRYCARCGVPVAA